MIGDVEGQNCLMVDDLIDTAGTLVKGAEALLETGRCQCFGLRYACGAFGSGGGADRGIRVEGSGGVRIRFRSRKRRKNAGKIRSLSVAPLLARAIQSIHEETSVSVLFI